MLIVLLKVSTLSCSIYIVYVLIRIVSCMNMGLLEQRSCVTDDNERRLDINA